MAEENEYDVVVVGAGPAGATAAYVLSRGGLSVLVLEKRRLPREKVCGGVLTLKTVMLLERVFGETGAALRERGVVEFDSNGYEVYRRAKLMGRFRAEDPFLFVRRASYDAFLVEKAIDAGTRCLDGQPVAALDAAKNEIVTSSGLRVRARFIVGADGANSVVRGGFPAHVLDEGRTRDGVAVALQVEARRSELTSAPSTPAIYYGFVLDGYGWAFPGPERIVVGMGCLPARNRKPLGQVFRGYLAEAGWGELLAHPVRAARVPYGNFVRRPAHANTLLVGDAAGLVDPLTGEGIYFAQRSGELAARSILESVRDGADFRTRYVERLRAHIHPSLRKRRGARRLFFGSEAMRLPLPVARALFSAFRNRLERHLHGVAAETRAREDDVDWRVSA